MPKPVPFLAHKALLLRLGNFFWNIDMAARMSKNKLLYLFVAMEAVMPTSLV